MTKMGQITTNKIKGWIKHAYDRLLRPSLPRKLALCNDDHRVVARRVRLLDATDRFPDYEQRLLDAIDTQVRSGDHVIDIGGGFGVAATVAAKNVGSEGSVTVLEPASEQADLIRETVDLNGVTDRVTVRQAAVGPPINVWGNDDAADQIRPADVPDADVLIVDIDGAEFDVIPKLQFGGETKPRHIIVEMHTAWVDQSPSRIYRSLSDHGYEIQSAVEPNSDIGVEIVAGTLHRATKTTPLVPPQVWEKIDQ